MSRGKTYYLLTLGYEKSVREWLTEPRALGYFAEVGQPWGAGHPARYSSRLLRIPLHKGKSIRKALKESGMLEDFLKTHQYAISSKYSKSGQVASEPLLNYMDVSGSAPLPVTAITQGVVDPPPLLGPPPLSPFRGVTKTQGVWPPRPGPSVSSAALGSRPRCRRGLSSDELPADSVPWFHRPLPGPSLHLPLLAPGARVSFWTRQAWGSWWPVHHCPGCGRKAPRAWFLSGARLSLICRLWWETAHFFPSVLVSPSRSPCALPGL